MTADAEMQRILAGQESRLTALTARSTALTAVVALAGVVLGAQVQARLPVSWWVISITVASLIVGVLVALGARLAEGAGAVHVLEWSRTKPNDFATLVMFARFIAAYANEARVRRVERAFYLQALLVGLAVVLAALDTVVEWL